MARGKVAGIQILVRLAVLAPMADAPHSSESACARVAMDVMPARDRRPRIRGAGAV